MRDLILLSFSPGALPFKRVFAWCYWVLGQRLVDSGMYEFIINTSMPLLALPNVEETFAKERGYSFVVPKGVAKEMRESGTI